MQHAVHDRLAHVGGLLRADDDVAELARAGNLAVLVDPEGQHVGRLIFAAVLAVERPDALAADERDRKMAAAEPRRGQRQPAGAGQPITGDPGLRVKTAEADHVELEPLLARFPGAPAGGIWRGAHALRRGRSSGAIRWACSS